MKLPLWAESKKGNRFTILSICRFEEEHAQGGQLKVERIWLTMPGAGIGRYAPIQAQVGPAVTGRIRVDQLAIKPWHGSADAVVHARDRGKVEDKDQGLVRGLCSSNKGYHIGIGVSKIDPLEPGGVKVKLVQGRF